MTWQDWIVIFTFVMTTLTFTFTFLPNIFKKNICSATFRIASNSPKSLIFNIKVINKEDIPKKIKSCSVALDNHLERLTFFTIQILPRETIEFEAKINLYNDLTQLLLRTKKIKVFLELSTKREQIVIPTKKLVEQLQSTLNV